MLQLVPAFVFLNQRLVFQLREIVRYCSLQLVVVTVASDWMAYAMRRRFGLAWFGVSAASFFASAAIPVNSRRFRWLFCSCEVALDSSREALSSYTIFGSFVGWIESAKLLFLRVISSLQICAGSELLRSLRKLRFEGERQYRTLIFPAGFLLSVLGFDPMSLRGLVCFRVCVFAGNPGNTAGRGFSPAGGAPGGG
ncbi:hypothetical protein F511_33089 [Dorcoceras hygrometricum]|uniref:Uncharacterized protein n=1 Tax=Dorcoceras hygrometricum TaxID=472368 RepID=A0A2Z7DGH9_9LAMI|nr:hypothetical protein F511_33089 [Dorcoceras hygrometricum]